MTLSILNVETSIYSKQPDGSYWLKEIYTRSDDAVIVYNTLINSDVDLQNLIAIRSANLCRENE
jgi:hypothetical protein